MSSTYKELNSLRRLGGKYFDNLKGCLQSKYQNLNSLIAYTANKKWSVKKKYLIEKIE